MVLAKHVESSNSEAMGCNDRVLMSVHILYEGSGPPHRLPGVLRAAGKTPKSFERTLPVKACSMRSCAGNDTLTPTINLKVYTMVGGGTNVVDVVLGIDSKFETINVSEVGPERCPPGDWSGTNVIHHKINIYN